MNTLRPPKVSGHRLNKREVGQAAVVLQQSRSSTRSKLLIKLLILVLTSISPIASASTICLTDSQCTKLNALVKSDPEAAARFAEIRTAADASLGMSPNAIALIQSEGKLASDPVKIHTWKCLDDMLRLQSLAYAYAATGDEKYATKIRQFIQAWADLNHSAGDPIDDTNLEPLIVAYDFTRDTFRPADRDTVDQYLRGIAEAEIKTGQGPAHTNVNNWNSHRVKIVGLIAFTLQDRSLLAYTFQTYRKQIQQNILPDGSSIDFHDRDALHYHEYDIRPLLTLAIAARNNGQDFFDYKSPTGSSLAAAVEFLRPYADGSKTHPEFVNSTVDFDRKRADAGEKDYKAGRLWDSHNALASMELAELFDPTLLPVVRELARSDATRFPTWQTVLNAARAINK
jgi:hypothetical protein